MSESAEDSVASPLSVRPLRRSPRCQGLMGLGGQTMGDHPTEHSLHPAAAGHLYSPIKTRRNKPRHFRFHRGPGGGAPTENGSTDLAGGSGFQGRRMDSQTSEAVRSPIRHRPCAATVLMQVTRPPSPPGSSALQGPGTGDSEGPSFHANRQMGPECVSDQGRGDKGQ